jgi:hypothetical protein
MASTTIFQTLRERVEKSGGLLPFERRAMFWFKEQHQTLDQWQRQNINSTFTTVTQQKIAKKLISPRGVLPGYLYFFVYQPFYAKQLDYYDRVPFTLVLERDKTGFLALNFHYLPYHIRAAFFDVLHSTRLQKSKDPLKSRMMVTYKLLTTVSKYKAFRPCLKRYRYTNCRSQVLQVGETEWDIALFMPVEHFSKMSRTAIWKESLVDIYGVADDGDEGDAGEEAE